MRVLPAASALVFSTITAFSQTPYAGMQTRAVKSLSDQHVADLQAGRGMSLALAAELNGYPGPSHILELADRLELSPNQRAKVQEMFAAMTQEAVALGSKLIEQETELNRQFADRTITPVSLKFAIAAIASTQGELRETHLKYHLSAITVLTERQLDRYSELRGYRDHSMKPMQHHN